MVIDGDGEDVAGRLVDDTEAVTLALHDVDNRPGDSGSTLITTAAVDGAGVRNRDDARSDVTVEERKGSLLPPVTDLDDL